MDAKKIYNLLKPHLKNLDSSEKKVLSRLICGKAPQKITSNHRSIISLAAAKQKLKKVCRREMEREKQKQRLHIN